MSTPLTPTPPWQWSPDTLVNLGVLLIDRVGSTKESQALPAEAFSQRQSQYYAGVEDRARAHGAYDAFNWQGDGVMLLLWAETPAALAQKVADLGIELWQRIQVELGMQARIAGHLVAEVKWNPNPGQLSHREINLCGHLEKDAPDGSFVVSEDVYGLLGDTQREKFGPLGESKRDGTSAYRYPKGQSCETFHLSQEFNLWSNFRRYSLGKEIASIRCIGFPLRGQVPRDLQVEEVFVLPSAESIPEPALQTALRQGSSQELDFSARLYGPYSVPAFPGHKRGLIVLGEPGSGKTTLLRWLAIVAAKGRFSFQSQTGLDERRLPLPISVGRLSEIRSSLGGHCSVLQALARYYQERNIGSASELETFLKTSLAQGQCLVLLDGLDEVGSNRAELTDWLESFASIFPDNRYVASSRVVGYTRLRLPDSDEIRLTPFSDKQVKQYLIGFHRACQGVQNLDQKRERVEQIADKQTSDLLAEIRADARLASVARNPFLLLILALVHSTEGRLPRHRVQFYQIAARTLCETWARSRRLVPGPERTVVHFEEEALPILGSLALQMHKNYPDGAAPKQWVVETLAAALVEQKGLAGRDAKNAAETFLSKAGEEAGLLSERGEGVWGFLHLTFQEYFTAAGLHAREEFESQALQNLFEPRWEEVLRLGVGYMALVQGRLKAAANFVLKVAEQSAPPHAEWISEILHKQVALAALLGAEVAETMDVAAKAKIFEPFLNWAFAMPKEISARYLREIGVIAPETLTPLLWRLFSDSESEKRQQAAWAAGILHDETLAEPLLALLDDAVADVRSKAAISLGAIGVTSALDKLIHGLASDPIGEVRAAYAESLGLLSDRRAIPALVDALEDSDQSVLEAVVKAFKKICPQKAPDSLIRHRPKAPHRIALALLVAWPTLMDLAVAERFFANTDPKVRRVVTRAVTISLDGRFLPLIRRALSDADSIVRSWAVIAIRIQEPEDCKSLLTQAARDTEDFVAASAISELAELDQELAAKLLADRKPTAETLSEWIAKAAVDIMAQLPPDSAVPELTKIVQTTSFPVWAQEQALVHLWRFADIGPDALKQQEPAENTDTL